MKDIYYIENIDISEDLISLILSMNFYSSEFNETDEFPITEIKLVKPKINLTIEEIKDSIDLYNDGFTFDINIDNNILYTSDMGNNKNEIRCEQVVVTHREYSYNELTIFIKQHKEYQDTSFSTINELNTKIDSLRNLINKEIDSIENKLKISEILRLENKKKRWQIELDVYKRMINKLK